MTDVERPDLAAEASAAPSAEWDADDHDPFAAFDAAMGVGKVSEIHPTYHALREACPVHEGFLHPHFGVDVPAREEFVGDRQPYAVLSFDTVQQVLKDGETFSSAGYANSIGLVLGHSILEMDEPEHRRYRGLIQQAFTRKAMERWEVELVHPIVHGLVDQFVDRGRAELVRELFFPFPVHVIAGMLGLPSEGLTEFHRAAVQIINIAADVERGFAASQWLYDYFAAIIAERRADPRDDVISVLVEAELDGQRLTDDEIIAFLRLLLPAGAETTYRSSSNLMFALLTHPDQLAALRDDRSLMPQAIEEGIRWDPPLTSIGRTCTRDTVVEGVPIPAGAKVQVCMAAANHDPTRWDRPDEFDILREPKQHMAFAFGPHMCLGMHLARMETTVAVDALLDLPDLRLDPDAEDVHISGLAFRAPARLPVVFG